jgi:phage terminase small subunit
MATLQIWRHEVFAREIARGAPPHDAAKRAGFDPATAPQTADKLMTEPNVVRRIAELKEAATRHACP